MILLATWRACETVFNIFGLEDVRCHRETISGDSEMPVKSEQWNRWNRV